MLAIETPRLFDGVRAVTEGATVVIDDGRILGVAPRGTRLPSGCERIRFADATLLPGLIDAHVHLCCDGGPDALLRLPEFDDEEQAAVIERSLLAHRAAGVTCVRDLGDREWAVVDWRDRHGEPTNLPRVLASGPPITSVGGHCWNMGGEVRGVDALRQAVRERADRGVDIVKIMASGDAGTPGSDPLDSQFGAEQLGVVVGEARRHGLRVVAHAHPLDVIRDAVLAGVDGIEHCGFLTAAGVDVDPTVVVDLVESGVAVGPTLGTVPGAEPPEAAGELMRRAGLTYERRIRDVGDLFRGGVRLVSGSDGGVGPGRPHGVLPYAVADLVAGGVPPADALASATSVAADVCGIAHHAGRVRPGLVADLLIVRGDPFADIVALRDVAAVYVRGVRCE